MNIVLYSIDNAPKSTILSEILQLLKNGGAIPNLNSASILENCHNICYIKDNEEIASTGAIKFDRPDYRKGVFNKAGVGDVNTSYLELGYVATSYNHSRKGYAKAICHSIIQNFPLNNIFATTRTDNMGMQKILTELGFTIRGHSYKSTNGDYKINLLTKII